MENLSDFIRFGLSCAGALFLLFALVNIYFAFPKEMRNNMTKLWKKFSRERNYQHEGEGEYTLDVNKFHLRMHFKWSRDGKSSK